MRDIHVRIAQDHALRFPPAKVHERNEVAIGRVMPRGPGVAAIVRMEIDNAGALTGTLEAHLDRSAPVAQSIA